MATMMMTYPTYPTDASDTDLIQKLINTGQGLQMKRRKRDKYYRGAQRLAMMGLATPPEMRELQTVVNWCRTTIDALSERLDVEGFRTGIPTLDTALWDWWKHNDMFVQSDAAHTESLVQGISFVVVGRDPENPDLPRYTVESSEAITVEFDQYGRELTSAVRYYVDPDTSEEFATLYLPNVTRWYARQYGRWILQGEDQHNIGIVPVVPLVNRSRVNDWFGETEMKDVMTIVDAVCRTATNLSAASETLAVPSRYVIGASREDFIDADTGEPVPVWEGYLGRLNALTNEDAKVVQLEGANLENFTKTVELYGKVLSSLTGLPIHYLGIAPNGNPASADAIRSGESRHVKRAERKQTGFGSGWSRVNEIALRLIVGADYVKGLNVSTVWRDAATPTVAAKTDAVVKLVQARILPIEGAWMEMGYDAEKRALYRSLMSNDPMERMVAAMANPGTEDLPDEDEPPESGDDG